MILIVCDTKIALNKMAGSVCRHFHITMSTGGDEFPFQSALPRSVDKRTS